MFRIPTSRPRFMIFVGSLCLALAGALVSAAPAQAAPVTVPVGAQFTTTGGDLLHAHGGGVLKVGSYYYWFGENRNANGTFRYVSAYRSADLRNWEFRNNVLTQSSAAELQVANIERPKVMYNAGTGQFVMWMHKENGSDYCGTGANQQWRIQAISGGHVQLIARQQYSCHTGTQQQFTRTPL